MRKFIIDKAPGKELIPKIIREKSFIDFNEFYQLRVNWFGYPLIHDRATTYSLFADLEDDFPNESEAIKTFIDYSIEIANQEGDKKFINAIFLISLFSRKGEKNCIPSKTQIQKINELKPRVQKLSFISYTSIFWNKMLDYCAKDTSFPKELFVVKDTDYIKLIDLNFPSIDNNTPKSCPILFAEIEKQIVGIVGEHEPLKFIRSAIIERDKYWVWHYPDKSYNIWTWYIIVKEDEFGKVILERHANSGRSTKTIEKTLLDYHYNPALITM